MEPRDKVLLALRLATLALSVASLIFSIIVFRRIRAQGKELEKRLLKSGYDIPARLCLACKVKMMPIAHDTGDGWWLSYECAVCGDVVSEDNVIDWPFACGTATESMLEERGFTIV